MKKGLLLLSLCSGIFSMNAQNADEIIKKHIDAIGGREKLKSISSVKTEMKMKAQMFEFPVMALVTKDGSTKTETTIQGMKMEQAYDASAKTGWFVNPMMGDKSAQKMNEEQLQDMTDENKIESPLLDYKEKGHSVEYLGKDDVDGEEVFLLMLTKKNGNVIYYYIDSQNYMIWKEKSKVKLKEKEYEGETYFYNYNVVDGITTAFTTEVYSDGKVAMQTNVEKIEYNQTVEPSTFKMPEKKK